MRRYLLLTVLLCVEAGLALWHGDVQLISTTRANEGLLQVYDGVNQSWGFVCDDGGNLEQLGRVACRNLGEHYINAVGAQVDPYKTPYSEADDFALDDVVCTGDEENLNQCSHRAWWTDNCYTSADLVLVTCTGIQVNPKRTGDVRLVNGTNKYEGLLQVFDSHDGLLTNFQRWGFVCDDGKKIEQLARVACRNLRQNYVSYRHEYLDSTHLYTTRPYDDDFALDNVICTGTENNLRQCDHSSYWNANCVSSELVWVKCTEHRYFCEDRPRLDYCQQGCRQLSNGYYNCTCEPGYTLHSNDYSCVDIDECATNNGGCSHQCVNYPGHFACRCPSYMEISRDDLSTCVFPEGSPGLRIDCQPQGMQINFRKQEFFFLPEPLSLTDTAARCQSKSNSTHIWLYTNYNDCSTGSQTQSGFPVYTNFVRNLPHSTGAVKFFETINIPFQCTIRPNASMAEPVIEPELAILRIESNGLFSSGLHVDKTSYNQGEEVAAILNPVPSYFSPVKSTVQCSVISNDNARQQQLIQNGNVLSFMAKIQDSFRTEVFKFDYKVFAFHNYNNQVRLQCTTSMSLDQNQITPAAAPNTIVTQTDINTARLQLATQGQSSTIVIDPTNLFTLTCTNTEMQLARKPGVIGVRYSDLTPLNGQRQDNHDGHYSVPLFGSGGQVSLSGENVVFTNTLIYSRDVPMSERKYKNVMFTVSCSYKLTAITESKSYQVLPGNFKLEAEDGNEPTLDVKLNLFTDGTFTQIVPTGQMAGTWNVDKIYGGVHIANNNQPNLKVRLDTCRLQSSPTGTDPKGTTIIENGCRTTVGAFLASDNQFVADLKGLNIASQVYVHCGVMICGGQNPNSRCNRPCLSNGAGGAIGKRTTDDDEDVRIVNVKAGPFSFK